MKPDRIEELRKAGYDPELCELALDGLRFQMWIKLAASRPATVAVEIAKCITPNQYRAAIDRLIVEEARR